MLTADMQPRLSQTRNTSPARNSNRLWGEGGASWGTRGGDPLPALPFDGALVDARSAPLEADRELVTRILRGDRRAQGQFVLRFERLIHRALHALYLSEQEREDLFQQVFLHLWEQDCRRLKQWQGRGGGKFSSYLRVIVRRLVYDAQRHRADPFLSIQELEAGEATAPPDGLIDRAPGPEEILMSAEQKRAIQAVILSLSPRDAELIRRRHFKQQS